MMILLWAGVKGNLGTNWIIDKVPALHVDPNCRTTGPKDYSVGGIASLIEPPAYSVGD